MPLLLTKGSFFGHQTGVQTARDLNFVEARFSPDTDVPPHAHESGSIYLILEGFCAERYGRKSRDSVSNTLVFHPPEHTHSGIWKHDDGLCFNIEIAPERLDAIREYAPLPVDAVDFEVGLPNQIALRLHREFREADSVSELAMEGMTLELLAALGRSAGRWPESRPPRWLRTVEELLRARFRESLSLGEVAAAAGVHPSHLARVFRQHYRCSVGDFVRQLRMELLLQQVVASELSLGEIAHAAGFADQSHFTRTFKRAYGITPLEYRRRFSRCTADSKK